MTPFAPMSDMFYDPVKECPCPVASPFSASIMIGLQRVQKALLPSSLHALQAYDEGKYFPNHMHLPWGPKSSSVSLGFHPDDITL